MYCCDTAKLSLTLLKLDVVEKIDHLDNGRGKRIRLLQNASTPPTPFFHIKFLLQLAGSKLYPKIPGVFTENGFAGTSPREISSQLPAIALWGTHNITFKNLKQHLVFWFDYDWKWLSVCNLCQYHRGTVSVEFKRFLKVKVTDI